MTSTLAGLRPARQFGPWALDLEPGERRARLRSLRAIVRMLLGPRGTALATLLDAAEDDDTALPPAADALDALPSLDLRRVLASYSGLARPLPPARRFGTMREFVRPSKSEVPGPLRLDAGHSRKSPAKPHNFTR